MNLEPEPGTGTMNELWSTTACMSCLARSGPGSPYAPAPRCSTSQPLTVQIQQTDGLCWEAIYSGPAALHTSTIFKDKAD